MKTRTPAKRITITDTEIRAVHALIYSTLIPKAVRDDPDSSPLKSFERKLRRFVDEVHCSGCGKPEIHAKGLCVACYRAKQRKGEAA